MGGPEDNGDCLTGDVDPNAGYGDRPCGRCGLFVIDGQPDPCWGRLPGVEAACCGHDFGVPYIKFTNGATVSFESNLVQVTGADEAHQIPCADHEDTYLLPSEGQVTALMEQLLDLLDPLLGPDLSVGTRVEDDELLVEITAVLNGGSAS